MITASTITLPSCSVSGKPLPESALVQPRHGADALQRPLRSRFRARLMPGVRPEFHRSGKEGRPRLKQQWSLAK